jgi:WD40 repeat protein
MDILPTMPCGQLIVAQNRGQQNGKLILHGSYGGNGAVERIAVTADGRRIISASPDKTLKVWDLTSGQLLSTLEGHTDEVTGVAVTADGRWVISASHDYTLKVWDLASGQLARTLKGHTNAVNGLAVTADGRWAVSASYDGTLKVWDVSSGQIVRTFEVHTNLVCPVAVTANGRWIVSASADDLTLKVWDVSSGQIVRTLEGHTSLVTSVTVTADDQWAVSASADHTLKIWNIGSGQLIRTLEGHTDMVTGVAVTADGHRAVSASYDKTLKVWDLGSRQSVRVPEGHTHEVTGVAVTADGRWAVSASHDHTLKVWDLGSGQLVRTLEGHTGRVYGVAVTRDGRRAVSASYDKTLKVWDLDSGKLARTLEGHTNMENGVAVTRDGRWAVVSGSYDKTLKVWDLDSGKLVHMLNGHTHHVAGVAVADGQRAVSASADHTLKIWDLGSGQLIRTLEGHKNWVSDVAVTADGRWAVSASLDNTLRIWDLSRGQLIRTLEGHRNWGSHVAVAQDGRWAVTISSNNMLRIWDLTVGLTVAMLETHAPFRCCAVACDRLILAGDRAGALHLLDWLPPDGSASSTLPARAAPRRPPTPTRPAISLTGPRPQGPSPMPPTVALPPARPAPRPIPAAAFPASAVFLSIAVLPSMAGPDIQAAMSALHRILRAALTPLALPDIRILSSLTGAIVLVPDALNRNLHDLLPAWLGAIDAAGLPIRAGVSRGLVELIADADGTVNAIGRPINVAARLAASATNPGVLYDEPYATHVQASLPRKHFLHPAHPSRQHPVTVKGKRTELFTCFADPTAPSPAPGPIATDATPPFVNAVLLAYDLPDFSDGDLRTLASRFRAVVQEVQRLREEHGLPAGVGVSFSPGGDGGVLALTQVAPGRAFVLATELASLLEAAGTTQSADAPVRARIGVHYGQVLPYENAEGVTRPTGIALFDADGLAGDDEARRYDAIVVSGALIESAAKGTGEAGRFEEIGPFTTAQGTTIRRYVPRDAPRRGTPPAARPPAPATRGAPPPEGGEHAGAGLEALVEALVRAFPSRGALERMLLFKLDMRLDEIAAPGNLRDTVFEVARAAEAAGWLSRLLDAALAQVPESPALRAIAAKRRT